MELTPKFKGQANHNGVVRFIANGEAVILGCSYAPNATFGTPSDVSVLAPKVGDILTPRWWHSGKQRGVDNDRVINTITSYTIRKGVILVDTGRKQEQDITHPITYKINDFNAVIPVSCLLSGVAHYDKLPMYDVDNKVLTTTNKVPKIGEYVYYAKALDSPPFTPTYYGTFKFVPCLLSKEVDDTELTTFKVGKFINIYVTQVYEDGSFAVNVTSAF